MLNVKSNIVLPLLIFTFMYPEGDAQNVARRQLETRQVIKSLADSTIHPQGETWADMNAGKAVEIYCSNNMEKILSFTQSMIPVCTFLFRKSQMQGLPKGWNDFQ